MTPFFFRLYFCSSSEELTSSHERREYERPVEQTQGMLA